MVSRPGSLEAVGPPTHGAGIICSGKTDAYRGLLRYGFLCQLLWWGQLVTSPLWAQELSFEHLLEIARTQIENNKLSTQRVSGFCLPIVAMPSQLYNLPFGIPLSLPHYSNINFPGFLVGKPPMIFYPSEAGL
jgi:hypothetical protein